MASNMYFRTGKPVNTAPEWTGHVTNSASRKQGNNTFNRNIKTTVIEMALIDFFCSDYVNKMKKCLSFYW